MNWSINQEIFRSNNPAYNGIADCEADGAMIPCDTEIFHFGVDNVTASTYTLQVTALGDQANDKAKSGDYCGGNGQLLTLDQNGVKNPPACWD